MGLTGCAQNICAWGYNKDWRVLLIAGLQIWRSHKEASHPPSQFEPMASEGVSGALHLGPLALEALRSLECWA